MKNNKQKIKQCPRCDSESFDLYKNYFTCLGCGHYLYIEEPKDKIKELVEGEIFGGYL